MPSLRHAVRRTLPRHALAVCVGALALAAAPASAGAATRYLAPGGSDAGACEQNAPCGSFERAYAVAGSGDTVEVAPGIYGEERVPGGTKTVAFRGGPGVILRQMSSDASNVTYDGINVDAAGRKTTGAAFGLSGSNSTLKNASVGNVVDEKGMLASGSNLTVDNVVFHDAVLATDGVHMECLYAIGVPGFTIRNSSFRDCAIMDLFFTYGSWWTPQEPAYGNVTVENNVFGHPEDDGGQGWHYYSLYIAHIGPAGAADPMSGWTVRNNTFESPAFIAPDRGSDGTRWVGNLGSWDCKDGIDFRANVGKACSRQDKAVSPASSNRTTTAAFGWVDPAGHDFRLKAGSPAIDAAAAGDAPALDRAGLVRDAKPDAGAFEFGASAPGAGGAPPVPAVEVGVPARLGVRFARLSPRTICRRARRGCPSAARLRLGTSRDARATVRVQRLRKGRRAKPVRTLQLRRLARTHARRIRARGLRKGRYRVLVTARDATGLRSRTVALKLRVR